MQADKPRSRMKRKADTNKILSKALSRNERHRVADTASYLYTKVELLGRHSSPRTPNLGKNKMRIYFSAAGQSFGHAATNWHSKSYYRHEQVTICFLCLYSFESQFLWYFIVNDDVYELPTTKPCIKLLGRNSSLRTPFAGKNKM